MYIFALADYTPLPFQNNEIKGRIIQSHNRLRVVTILKNLISYY